MQVLRRVIFALAIVSAMAVASAGPNAGAADDPLAIPEWAGEQPDALAKALEYYNDGRWDKALSRASRVADDRDATDGDREAAAALVAFIEAAAQRLLDSADSAFQAQDFIEAKRLWDGAADRLGNTPGGKLADDQLDAFKDDALEARLEAQLLLAEAVAALHEGDAEDAEKALDRLVRKYGDTPELGAAEAMLEAIAAGDLDAALELTEKRIAANFGIVTSTERVSGDLDCKGDCQRLVQGGYLKFDLSQNAPGTTVRSAALKVFVKSTDKNPWLWVCHLPLDPTEAPVGDVFNAIQRHATIISGVRKIRAGQWETLPLSARGVQLVNEALAKQSPQDRWIALALTFE